MSTIGQLEIPAVAEVAQDAAHAAVTEIVGEAIERENAAADEATEIAEQIIAGAMETERGREIQDLKEGLSECRTTLEQLPSMLADSLTGQMLTFREEMLATLETTRAECLSAVAGALAALAGQAPIPSPELIPPASEVDPASLTAPAESSEPEAPPAPPKRKNRFL